MDAKRTFSECCKEAQIDCKETFRLGVQNPKRADRWEYRCDATKTKPTHKYAVCFFPAGGFYAAWNLRASQAKRSGVFSILKDSVPKHLTNRVVSVTKAVEYEGRGTETVLIFTTDGIMEFLERYCKDE